MGGHPAGDDDFELTGEDAFILRRAQVIAGRLGEHGLAAGLRHLADDHDAPEQCEGCDFAATTTDADGAPLCTRCEHALRETLGGG
jgi:hypothetical protein